MIDVDNNPDNFAACLVTYLEARGAVLTVVRGDLRADLNALHDFGTVPPEVMISTVLHLAPQIKRILRARRRVH